YLSDSAGRYLISLEKDKKKAGGWPLWFSPWGQGEIDKLIFAVTLFKEVLQGKKGSEEFKPFPEILITSQIGYHFQVPQKIFRNELTSSLTTIILPEMNKKIGK